jgi:hypothetical protein
LLRKKSVLQKRVGGGGEVNLIVDGGEDDGFLGSEGLDSFPPLDGVTEFGVSRGETFH